MAALLLNTVWPLIKSAIAWFLGSIAAETYMRGSINALIVAEARERLQLDLNADDPLSKESFAIAFGARFGLVLDPVEPFTKASLGVAVGQKIGFELDPVEPFSKESFGSAIAQRFGLPDHFSRCHRHRRLLHGRSAKRHHCGAQHSLLGTSFTKLFPADASLLLDFERQIVLQLEKALLGQPSLIRGPTVDLITTRIRTHVGSISPRDLAQTEHRHATTVSITAML